MNALKKRLGPWVRRSVWLTTIWFLADNLLASLRIKNPGPPKQDHLSGEAIEADITYSTNVVENYAKFGAARGRVAEIGPGGSAATALLMIERGADSVELLDRFVYPHDQSMLNRTYSIIIGRSSKLTALFPDPANLGAHVRFETGEPAAAERYFENHKGYDAVCSCAVLEHLFDPILALKRMTAALNIDGKLVHYVDFRDHAMYTAGGLHELTFLTIPRWIYPHMSRRRGRPNRVLIGEYRSACAELGLDFQILATSLVGVGFIEHMPYAEVPAELRAKAEARVEAIRGKLAEPYRSMAACDLAIDSIALIATKRST